MQAPKPFKLERFFAEHEFSVERMLCNSDVQPLSVPDLLKHADADDRKRWEGLELGYGEYPGDETLRQHIAKAFYTKATENDINCVVPEEGIFLSMLTLLQPGSEVICMMPSYQSLHAVAESLQCKVHAWNPKQDDGGFLRFDVQDALDLLASHPKVKVVVVNVPHNPTGLTLRRADLHRLVDACKGAGSYLFMDEMYRFLEWDEHGEEGTLPSACDLYERGITLCGLSKTFACPGLRMGWIACRDAAFMKGLAMRKDYTTICPPGPSECLALIAIKQRKRIIKRSMDLIRTNAATVQAFCEKHADCIAWQPPQAGPIAFPKILIPGMGATDFCKALLKEQNTLLLPGTVYEGALAEQDDRVRFGLGRDPGYTNEGLERLAAFFRAHVGHGKH